jgi:hypothetical protein
MQAVMSTGVARDVAFGYAVLVHLTFYVPITLWGASVLVAHGLSIGRTLALSRDARPLGALPTPLIEVGTRLSERRAREETREPSRFMCALADASTPLEDDHLTGASRAHAVRDVATFIDGQMAALPFRLRALFATGMLGFRLATRLACLSSFSALPPERRRAWFERWAYGRVALARQLFRGVRSTALLAYYELPAARAALDARQGAGPAGGAEGART